MLQLEGQIELKKEKMLYQKHGTLHFRLSSCVISVSEDVIMTTGPCPMLLASFFNTLMVSAIENFDI